MLNKFFQSFNKPEKNENISFNDEGDVESCSGLPHVMVADSFKRKNDEGDRVEIEGADKPACVAQSVLRIVF